MITDEELTKLKVGDWLILNGRGAYLSSLDASGSILPIKIISISNGTWFSFSLMDDMIKKAGHRYRIFVNYQVGNYNDNRHAYIRAYRVEKIVSDPDDITLLEIAYL